MSVIIKDMKMPESCYSCPCARHDSFDGIQGYQCNVTLGYIKNEIVRLLDCPLIEIPTPHGRLVDGDALIAAYDAQRKCMAGHARKLMEEAPTIIEAEGEE